VVTNLGFSDWATLDIRSKIHSMWYRIQSRQHDFLIEYSYDGVSWNQLRITHLLSGFEELNIGLYACSPGKGSFVSIFDKLLVEESRW
jgi:regulation of enolase protein 1 (concanavalin A-like superfamily)